MTIPLVSVLVTSHNRETMVGDAIESVLAQTLGDFELLVVDDGSTDETVAVAESYAARDSRVRVHANAERLGQFPNRNRAARLARGTFIKYHDSDDLMYPHCLAVMVPPMLAEPRAAIGLSLPRSFSGGPVPMLLTPRLSYQREFLGMGMFYGGPAAGIFRRKEFLALGAFPDQGLVSDTLFWVYACARVNVLALPADLYWYRRHPAQEAAEPELIHDRARAAGAMWEALDDPSCPLLPDEVIRARETLVTRLIRDAVRDARARNWASAVARVRDSGLSFLQILRHARPRQHSSLAGTPLTPEGDFILPDWKVFGLSSGVDTTGPR